VLCSRLRACCSQVACFTSEFSYEFRHDPITHTLVFALFLMFVQIFVLPMPVRDEIGFAARVTIQNAVLNKSVYPGRASIAFFPCQCFSCLVASSAHTYAMVWQAHGSKTPQWHKTGRSVRARANGYFAREVAVDAGSSKPVDVTMFYARCPFRTHPNDQRNRTLEHASSFSRCHSCLKFETYAICTKREKP
jgi:hypothetical protein